MKYKIKPSKQYVMVVLLVLCNTIQVFSKAIIVYGDKADSVEINASRDLKNDIIHAGYADISIVKYKNGIDLSKYKQVIWVGTSQSNSYIKKTESNKKFKLLGEKLEPETFVLQSISELQLIIKGADVRGVFYGVYCFSQKNLGTDPFEYWTDKKPNQITDLTVGEYSFLENAPKFKYRGYFDNDNDMLANFKGRKLIVEYDLWQEMINSLCRLRYNYIDLHDLLGRPEFWLRDYYKKMTDYHTDLELVDSVIDYAHSKGMMVQIPMYLGWEFHHMDLDKVSLSKYHDHWMEVYEYYLTKTPFAKCDLFLQRPRHPYYDWPYKVEDEIKSGIEPAPLMNKMFEGLYSLIKKYRPNAVLFCDLWSEGRQMWNTNNFTPSKDIQMLWADDGFANFNEWPGDLKGYKFGMYIHAGVWLNNVTQNPYPELIKKASLQAVDRKMTENYFVNGQTFKNFILNIEACARCAWNPETFNADDFYSEWACRYWGNELSIPITKSLHYTHLANIPVSGYRDITKASDNLLDSIEKGNIHFVDDSKVQSAILLADSAEQLLQSNLKNVALNAQMVYDDQLLFPSRIFKMNMEFYLSVIKYNNFLSLKKADHSTKIKLGTEMQNKLLILRNLLQEGSIWKKWENWYKPENFRMHTPPPTMEQILNITKD